MTYIEYINNFWSLNELRTFTPVETKVYFYLLQIANRFMWENNWTYSDAKASSNIGVSLNTFKAARNSLKQVRLIDFKVGGKGKRDACRYQILTPNVTENLIPKLTDKPSKKPRVNNGTCLKDKDKDKDISSPSSAGAYACEGVVVEDMLEYVRNKKSIWMEAFCMNNHITVTEFEERFMEFIRMCQDQGVEIKEEEDIQKHFANWYRKIKNLKKSDNNGDNKFKPQTRAEQRASEIDRRNAESMARIQSIIRSQGGDSAVDREVQNGSGLSEGSESEPTEYLFK